MPEEVDHYLYHYTTPEGLIGIVQTRRIWATSVFYLNDMKEFRHGIELSKKCVQALHDSVTEAFFRKLLTSVLERLSERDGFHTYVCSFSGLADDLSQWRAYCPTGGFAIGFPKDMLEVAAAQQLCYFEPCIYNPKEKEVAVNGWVDYNPDERSMRDADGILDGLISASATFKDQAFSAEKEWRMVYDLRHDFSMEKPEERVRFRASKGVLVPYVECSLDSTELWEAVRVTVGPTPKPEASIASVRQLLRFCSPAKNAAAVRLTSVPYRFW